MIRRPYIVISVRDPGTKRAKIRQTLGLKGVLYLAFHDAEPSEGSTLPTNIHMMTRSHAQQIWRFVNKHDQEVSAIVCHCEQGMSRSPAIASALAMHLGL